MFLKQLNEEEKDLFLQLSVLAAEANNEVEVEELQSLGMFCAEMLLPNHVPYVNETLEDILDKVNSISSAKIKNIMVLNILHLLKSDGVYDKQEHEFMEIVLNRLNIDRMKFKEIENILNIYLSTKTELRNLVNE